MTFMQKIMLRLFGHKPANKEPRAPIRFKTTCPIQKPTYQDWLKEFNVGMMWDRKIVKID